MAHAPFGEQVAHASFGEQVLYTFGGGGLVFKLWMHIELKTSEQSLWLCSEFQVGLVWEGGRFIFVCPLLPLHIGPFQGVMWSFLDNAPGNILVHEYRQTYFKTV